MADRVSKATPQRRITDAFITLFSQCHDVDSINVSDLCREAKVARTTFYAHYEDPYDVMQQLQDYLMDGLNAAGDRASRMAFSRSERYSSAYGAVDTMRFIAQNRPAFAALLCDGGDPLFIHKVNAHIETNMKNLFAASSKPVEQPDVVMSFISGAMYNSICHWIANRKDLSPEEFCRIVFELLSRVQPEVGL